MITASSRLQFYNRLELASSGMGNGPRRLTLYPDARRVRESVNEFMERAFGKSQWV
jgi:hypothetical protein